MSGVPSSPALALVASAFSALAVLLAPWPGRRRLVPGRAVPRAPSGPARVTVPVLLDLVRAALDAGLPTSSAVAAALEAAPGTVGGQCQRALLVLAGAGGAARGLGGLDAALADLGVELRPLVRCLALSERTGAAVGVLLLRAAEDERAARRRRASVAAGRLGVQLVLPLGLTTLPAFVLLGVAPVVIGLAGDVLVGG